MQQRLGRYELIERIATGGQGTIWRAQDTVLERIVAIKVLNQPVVDDTQYLEALQREARLAGGLVHPNITAVHDLELEGGIAFIVMEYVPDTLSNYLQDGQPLPYQRAVEIAIQICRALSHAHSREVIHRDIKLQNILLTNEGDVKVSDFGIARALTSSTGDSTTSTMGTPFYMSPEQWIGARVDGRSDIYSLGILLYEMLTGTVPFRAESIGAIYVQHLESEIPEISSELGIPDAVEAVMRMALEKDPENRFNSAEAMANALQRSLNPASQGHPDSNTPISQAPSPPQTPSQGPQRGPGRYSKWLIFGGSGVLLLFIMLVVIGYVIGSSDSGDRDVMVGMPDPTYTPYLPPTSLPTYTPFPTVTPRPTYTPAPTYTPYPTATPRSTDTPRPTLTPTPRLTSTPTPLPTSTAIPTPTRIPTPTTDWSQIYMQFDDFRPSAQPWLDDRASPDCNKGYCFKSGLIQPGGHSILRLNLFHPKDSRVNPKTIGNIISFELKTSTSGDKMRLIAGNHLLGEWGGIHGWQLVEFRLPDTRPLFLDWSITRSAMTDTKALDRVWIQNVHIR